jgi:hypothetical protein
MPNDLKYFLLGELGGALGKKAGADQNNQIPVSPKSQNESCKCTYSAQNQRGQL